MSKKKNNNLDIINEDVAKRKEISRRGGVNSGKARRARKTLKEELLAILSDDTIQNNLCKSLINSALSGSTDAFKTIRDTIGEQPTNKIEAETKLKIEDYFENNPLKM